MPPSNEPEKTTPGIALIAADCAALQPGALAHFNGGGGANQVRSPVASLTACSPPVGSKAWCEKMEAKDKGDWTANEAADYMQHCLIRSDR